MKHFDRWQAFLTAIIVTFVLLIHNGTEPVFLVAYAILPVLVLVFSKNKSPWPLVAYLVVFGVLGRYARYFRESYASDALLAIRDFVGYLLAGKHPYKEMIMAQSGLTPYTYLPFSLLWYLPAQVIGIDLRFFEMIISGATLVVFALIGMLTNVWAMLSVLSVVSLTPFLLDLSSDGSNDNSVLFLLLVSMLFLLYGSVKKRKWWGIASAIVLGFAAASKHYVAFFLLYFIPFVLQQKSVGGTRPKMYLAVFVITMAIVFLPFVLTEPVGFWRSLHFIEIGNWHKTWGWNVWVALRDGLGWEASKQTMWLVRTIGTGMAAVGCFVFFRRFTQHPECSVHKHEDEWYKTQSESPQCPDRKVVGAGFTLRTVFISAGITMLVYLALSNWTSYAYFTFLVPVFSLAVVVDDFD